MKVSKGYEKVVPAYSSTFEGRKRTTRVRIAALCSSVIVAAVICLVVGSIHLKRKEDRDGAGNALKPSYVMERACNSSLYRRVCVSSLSSYPGALRANLSELARIAVRLSFAEAKQVSGYAADLGRKATDEREIGALQDCSQQLQDTVDQLNSSMSELEHLNSNSLKKQMNDVQTWLSTALTNPSTCLEGLDEVNANMKPLIRSKSENLTELISNALAVVNGLSAVGDITNDQKIPLRNRRLLFEAGHFRPKPHRPCCC